MSSASLPKRSSDVLLTITARGCGGIHSRWHSRGLLSLSSFLAELLERGHRAAGLSENSGVSPARPVKARSTLHVLMIITDSFFILKHKTGKENPKLCPPRMKQSLASLVSRPSGGREGNRSPCEDLWGLPAPRSAASTCVVLPVPLRDRHRDPLFLPQCDITSPHNET